MFVMASTSRPPLCVASLLRLPLYQKNLYFQCIMALCLSVVGLKKHFFNHSLRRLKGWVFAALRLCDYVRS